MPDTESFAVVVFRQDGGWQAGRHTGAELVNAPGSWNWSDLKTHDTQAAKAFMKEFG